MRGKTHVAAGLAIGAAFTAANSLPFKESCFVMGVSAVGALLPDVDICTSKLGRIMAPASLVIQLIFGHRTIFHAPLLYAILYSLAKYCVVPEYQMHLTAALFGVISHLILDLLNHKGIPLFWPWKKRFHLANIHSGGIVDRSIGIVLSVATFYILANSVVAKLQTLSQSLIPW